MPGGGSGRVPEGSKGFRGFRKVPVSHPGWEGSGVTSKYRVLEGSGVASTLGFPEGSGVSSGGFRCNIHNIGFQKVPGSSGAWLHGISRRGIKRSVKLDRPAVRDATEAYSLRCCLARLLHVICMCFFRVNAAIIFHHLCHVQSKCWNGDAICPIFRVFPTNGPYMDPYGP